MSPFFPAVDGLDDDWDRRLDVVFRGIRPQTEPDRRAEPVVGNFHGHERWRGASGTARAGGP